MQRESQLFDAEIVSLARETRRVAASIDDPATYIRLHEMANDVLRLAYLGDTSDEHEFADALAGLGLNWDDCPAP